MGRAVDGPHGVLEHTVALHTSSMSCAALKKVAKDFASVNSMNSSAMDIS